MWSWMLLGQLAPDTRYGLRTMIANKTFSAMAILSLRGADDDRAG